MQYIYKNYLEYCGHGAEFTTKISDLQKTKNTYYQETVNAMRLLLEQKQGKIYVFYSGGIDSEYAIMVLKSIGVTVIPVIIKFREELNAHDTYYAFKFCKMQGLDPLVIDFDLIEFVKSGRILDISEQFKNYAYQYNATLHTITKFDGTIFMAEGDPYFSLDKNNNTWNYIEFERNGALINFFKHHNIVGTPLLLCYTSGMLSSILTDPVIKNLANHNSPGKTSSFSSRHKIYNNNPYFYLEPRQKYGGYEKFEQLKIFKQHPVFLEFEKLKSLYSHVHVRNYHTFIQEQNLDD